MISTDLYAIAARVKNLARMNDASLSPIGDALCNLHIHMLKQFYDLAETFPEPHRTKMFELIESKEGFCRDVINLNKKRER